MSCATIISSIEFFSADDLGRRRDWSDEEKVRIVEESLQGFRQGSATARRYGLSRSLLTRWRREYRSGLLNVSASTGPSPVLVRCFSEEGGWHDTCSGILGLTKMDWNYNTLYKKLPVTLGYSKAFADIIQQNPKMVDAVYDFRNFHVAFHCAGAVGSFMRGELMRKAGL